MTWLQKIAFPQMNSPVPLISPQEAHDTCDQKIGALYHGTLPEVIPDIKEQGFKREEGEAHTDGIRQGYDNMEYGGTGCSPPVHHLGYGIYFTQSKARAKLFGEDTARNVLEFWVLNGSRIMEINFAASNTMMKWWHSHGFDCELSKVDRVAATQRLTAHLSNEYDACLFTGRGFGRGLDGNQICVYNPSILRRIDKKLARSGEIGSTVQRLTDGMKGILLDRRSLAGFEEFHPGEAEMLVIRWRKGGMDHNVYPSQVEFL